MPLSTQKQDVSNVPLTTFNVSGIRDANSSAVQAIIFHAQATRVDDVDANTSYYGFALPGTTDGQALWRIQKKTTSGNVKSYTWADGNDFYDNVWTNRAGLTYS